MESMTKRDLANLKSGLDTLEQLVWLLRGNKLSELDKLTELISDVLKQQTANTSLLPPLQNSDSSKSFLVGSLPGLFQDQALFPNNEDIVEFAQSVLQIEITRWQKRSRYELIGLIVCETVELSHSGLADLVAALTIITNNDEKRKKMTAKKQAGGFSWNTAIQELLKHARE